MRLINTKKIKLKTYITVSKFAYKYLGFYIWPKRLINRKFSYEDYYPSGLCVNLGGGPYFSRDGWINADFIKNFSTLDNRVECDISKCLDELPFKDVQAYYLSHTLEHFSIHDAKKLLLSLRASLKQGGTLRIIVPDADLVIDRCKNNDIEYFRPLFSYFKYINPDQISNLDILFHLLCKPRCRIQHLSTSIGENYNSEWTDILHHKNSSILDKLNNHSFKQDINGSLHLSAYNSSLLIDLLNEAGFSQIYRSSFMQSRFPPLREAPIFDGTHPWLSLYVEAVK